MTAKVKVFLTYSEKVKRKVLNLLKTIKPSDNSNLHMVNIICNDIDRMQKYQSNEKYKPSYMHIYVDSGIDPLFPIEDLMKLFDLYKKL